MAKFKVGDRVIATKTFADITAGDGYTVVEVDHSNDDMPIRVVDDAGDRYWLYSNQFRILIPALTISTDKFCRTCNGKVTGRVSKGDTGFESVVDGKVRIYDTAGGHVHGDADLDIVEAWAPKVGERVRVIKTENFHPAVSSETECVVDSVTGDAIWLSASTESDGVLHQLAYLSDLEPLPVAAPQPAAPSLTGSPVAPTPVGAQVDTLAEEYGPAPQPEPDATLNIKFTSDFSDLDAAILVRKKKLKKLIKLARKAGIELREAA